MRARIFTKGIRWATSMALLAVATVTVPATSASAFELSQFAVSGSFDGEFSRQAAAHPDLTTVVRFPTDDHGQMHDRAADFGGHRLSPGLPA